jgi:hypothetical protein
MYLKTRCNSQTQHAKPGLVKSWKYLPSAAGCLQKIRNLLNEMHRYSANHLVRANGGEMPRFLPVKHVVGGSTITHFIPSYPPTPPPTTQQSWNKTITRSTTSAAISGLRQRLVPVTCFWVPSTTCISRIEFPANDILQQMQQWISLPLSKRQRP